MATQEQLESRLEKQMQELEKTKKKLKAKKKEEKEAKRKLDTKHKILLGGTVLSVLGREYIEGDEQRLRDFLQRQDERGGYFTSAMNKGISSSPTNPADEPDAPRPF